MMTGSPPRWDLTAWFADFGPEFDAWLDAIEKGLTALDATIAGLGPIAIGSTAGWVDALCDFEAIAARLQHAQAFTGARSAADVKDAAAQAAMARGSKLAATSTGVQARVISALGAADTDAFDALCAAPELVDATHYLSRWRAKAQRSASAAEERLAGELGVDGIEAWARLYRKVTGAMTFDLDGEQVPLAWLRGRLGDPDPEKRAAALAGATTALESQGVVFISALNAIAGTRLTLDARRGLKDPLDAALFQSAIERRTFDAMMDVVRDKAWIGRRFLALKARRMGRERIRWCDLRAPLGDGAPVPWSSAVDTVIDAFGKHHPDLSSFARSMLDEGRIEAEPRRGKRPGAFCTRSFVDGASRVYMSYTENSADVRTLAHELGHGYHNHTMRGLRPWARVYPMTLAETASIVAETLVSDAQLRRLDLDQTARLEVLDARLGQVAVYLLDIPTRLAFERAFYAERASGEVPVARACELMHQAQLDVFGDVLDPEGTHPWFWADKLHFYISGRRFYNYPYTFGYLFGQGVLARARQVGADAFHPTYVELLRQTARGTAEQVVQDVLGIDLGEKGFWEAALTGAEADLRAFEAAFEAA